MAGIGLELRRIYKGKKFFSEQKMYLYAAMYYGGPLLLGVFLVVYISALSDFAKMGKTERELLTSMFTYSVILSLLFSNTFSSIIGRYVSDMIYIKRFDKIIPTFFSSNLLTVLPGELLYGVLLVSSGVSLTHVFLCLMLFAELVILWNTVGFISSIKKYKIVLYAYLTAIGASVVLGMVLFFLRITDVSSMLFTVCIGYGIILFVLIRILFQTLPISSKSISSFEFLIWFDKYPQLLWLGFSLYVGAFSHIVSTWFSPVGEHIHNIFFHAPFYDVPAFYAFLTTLVTTVNFAIFIEVDFYEKFRMHYWLYNNQGTISEINEAKDDMLLVLKRELKYLAWKQMFATMIFSFIGTQILQVLPLGFTSLMLGYFRILCISYGIFAIAQSMILILLYFDDVRGATDCSIIYALLNIGAMVLNRFIPVNFYGFGFLVTNIVFYILAVFRLENVTKRLPYLILGRQPMILSEQRGMFCKLKDLLEKGGLDEEIHKENS